MITLRFDESCKPRYMTALSAGADLVAREGATIKAGQRGKVPTGVWIDSVDWSSVQNGLIPEIQVRCRSGLAFKHGLMLTNGVGTVDLDYKDEICVLLFNSGNEDVEIKAGDRVAQLVLALTGSFSNIDRGTQRVGGFGSTGVSSTSCSA
jgi:dUTP pyrophosphatase